MNLDTPVSYLPTVQLKVAQGLNKLGIKKVRHLLYHFPSRYEDRRNVLKIENAAAGTPAVFLGTIKKISVNPSFRHSGGKTRRLLLTKAILEDETGEIPVIWFHQKFIEKNYPKGSVVYLVGTPSSGEDGITLVAPEAERFREGKIPIHAGRLTPIYPETVNVTSRQLRYLISRILPLVSELKEYLPLQTLKNEGLISFKEAIKGIHFPESDDELFLSRQRLSFDELFILQLAALERKIKRNRESSVAISFPDNVNDSALKSLPFSLTPSQEEAVKIIQDDLRNKIPMNRLLAGDVGSGKTIVAGLSANAIKSDGAQAALVAPTEILAVQHAEGLSKLFKEVGLRVALLTGSTPKGDKELILRKIYEGDIDLLVGTHALFHAKLSFKKLGMVIVDEQHRFGVEQRDELTNIQTGDGVPHFLSLTATPIPRTLQLTAFGDVEVTPLDPRPNQKVVETKVILPEERSKIYKALAERMKNGEQVFVICPRVEEDSDKKSVVAEYKKLKEEIFKDFEVGMIHGKLKAEEKNEVLEAFRKKELDVLVASSVIEVGVDIPNATALLIEGAERFGLAQLHQFRGRVGRRGQKAVCYLASEVENPEVIDRLRVLEENSNGLNIAEEDLKRRGAGEIYGTKQSGGVRLKIASLSDIRFLLRARKAAEKLLAKDPEISSSPLLFKRIEQLNVTTHFE